MAKGLSSSEMGKVAKMKPKSPSVDDPPDNLLHKKCGHTVCHTCHFEIGAQNVLPAEQKIGHT